MNMNLKQKDQIINKILKNTNVLGYEAWNITKVLELLIKECEKRILEIEIKNQTRKSTRSKTESRYSNKSSQESNNF